MKKRIGLVLTIVMLLGISGAYAQQVDQKSVPFPSFRFPLKGVNPDGVALTPYTAVITSVFDHSRENDKAGDGVSTFTGERGDTRFGGDCSLDFGCQNSEGKTFIVNGNYNKNDRGGIRLFYNKHDGIDYGTKTIGKGQAENGRVPVYAAASGKVVCAISSCPGGEKYGIVKILHPPNNGYVYQTGYFHLSSASVIAGQYVKVGDPIGIVGDTGSEGAVHLHFQVMKDGCQVAAPLSVPKDCKLVPVDPYGWQGLPGKDPYTRAVNNNLWLYPIPAAQQAKQAMMNGMREDFPEYVPDPSVFDESPNYNSFWSSLELMKFVKGNVDGIAVHLVRKDYPYTRYLWDTLSQKARMVLPDDLHQQAIQDMSRLLKRDNWGAQNIEGTVPFFITWWGNPDWTFRALPFSGNEDGSGAQLTVVHATLNAYPSEGRWIRVHDGQTGAAISGWMRP